MADIEVRAFGHRFLLVWEPWSKPDASPEPDGRDHTSGSFDPASSPYYDGRAVDLGFRASRVTAATDRRTPRPSEVAP